MRLQKYLAHAGICSRRKAEEYIRDGKVRVNDTVITTLGTRVDVENDRVLFDNRPVRLKLEDKKIYIAVNKPKGVVTSCSRQKKSRIILDLIDIEERIYPIGRLDKDSTGLLLMTNDGDLHNRLSHPSYDHEKEYLVATGRPISDAALKKMADGMMIDNQKTRRSRVNRISENRFKIILKQGLNRQIRKMVKQTGNTVVRLERVRMANIRIGRLKPGRWRYLNPDEIKGLKGLTQ